MQFKSTISKLFLIDAIGAVVSTVMLGVVLVQLQEYIGMPENVLYALAAIAGVFAIYSLTCYRELIPVRALHLRMIAVGNLSYAALSAVLVAWFLPQLTLLGMLYFVGEIIIIAALAMWEWRVASST